MGNRTDNLSHMADHHCRKEVKSFHGDVQKDHGWAWVVLAASFLLQTITVGVFLSSGLFLIEFMDMFNSSHADTAWVASMQIGVAFLIGAPLSGLVSQRFSHRVSIVLGGIILAVGTFVSAFATGVIYLYLSYGLVSGIGIGLIYSPSIGVVGQYFDKHLSLALGITMAGGGCGAMIFSQLFYFLISYYSCRGALTVISALTLNCCTLGALMFPKTVNRLAQNSMDKILHNGVHHVPSQTGRKCHHFVSLLSDVRFILFFLSCFFFCYGATAAFILLADYAIDCGMSREFAPILLSITGLFSTIGRFIMAGLMHFLRNVKAVNLYAVSVVFCGTAVLLMPTGKTMVSFTAFCCVFGFCYGGCCSSTPVVASEFFGVHRLTRVFSYTLIASGLGCLLGSPTAGWMYEATRNYDLAMFFNGVMIILSFVVLIPLYFIICRRREHLQLIRSIIIKESVSLGSALPCKQPS